jgi:hypothetical protein
MKMTAKTAWRLSRRRPFHLNSIVSFEGIYKLHRSCDELPPPSRNDPVCRTWQPTTETFSRHPHVAGYLAISRQLLLSAPIPLRNFPTIFLIFLTEGCRFCQTRVSCQNAISRIESRKLKFECNSFRRKQFTTSSSEQLSPIPLLSRQAWRKHLHRSLYRHLHSTPSSYQHPPLSSSLPLLTRFRTLVSPTRTRPYPVQADYNTNLSTSSPSGNSKSGRCHNRKKVEL